MAIKGVGWESSLFPNEIDGFDIHVIANNEGSRPLDDLLVIAYDKGTTVVKNTARAATVDSIKVEFVPEINFTPTTTARVVTHAATGVTIHQDTGVVTFPGPKPHGSILKNFIIRALIKDATNTAFPVEPIIRIHLHNSILRAWLTPSTLTIRRDPNPMDALLPRPRFRVLAEFDDRVIGDVSGTPQSIWSSDKNDKVFPFANGGLWAKAEATGVKISLKLPKALADTVADPGLVDVKSPWSTPTPAQIVGFKRGASRIAGRLNLLFISEGFEASEEKVFRDLVVQLADIIRTKPGIAPFSLTKDSINIWSVFVPSRQTGTTTLDEVTPILFDSNLTWPAIWLPGSYPTGTAPLTLQQLVRAVGLPVQADSDAITLEQRIQKWPALYGTAFGNLAGRIPQNVYQAWLTFRARRLINDRDTAFGLEVGDRPRVHDPRGEITCTLSDLRVRRVHLDEFLKALTDGVATPTGPRIGDIWGAADGKDRANVIFLCRGARKAGSFHLFNQVMGVGLRDEEDVSATNVTGTPQVELVPFDMPAAPTVHTQAALVHEWGHALGLPGVIGGGLGDEYATEAVLTIPASSASGVRAHPNLQFRDDALTAGQLDGHKIRWGQWHRILKAAALASKPTKVGSQFRLKLLKAPPGGFGKDERVRLRERPLATALAASAECKIDVVESAKSLLVSAVSGTIDLTTFSDQAIVFVSRRKPQSATGTELMLVAKLIQDHIRTTHQPLNAASLTHVCKATGGTTQLAMNLPTSGVPTKLRFKQWIIGLYEGGHTYNCGVFHATGACLMRTHVQQVTKDGKTSETITPLCQVCRYILVDLLDPTLHGKIDDRYAGAWLE